MQISEKQNGELKEQLKVKEDQVAALNQEKERIQATWEIQDEEIKQKASAEADVSSDQNEAKLQEMQRRVLTFE